MDKEPIFPTQPEKLPDEAIQMPQGETDTLSQDAPEASTSPNEPEGAQEAQEDTVAQDTGEAAEAPDSQDGPEGAPEPQEDAAAQDVEEAAEMPAAQEESERAKEPLEVVPISDAPEAETVHVIKEVLVAEKAQPVSNTGKSSRGQFARRMISDVMFVAVLLVIFAVVLQAVFTSEGEPRVIGGYSFQIVLTDSMKSEIPPGSLVVVKDVPADTIVKGDIISFMQTAEKSITHKVVQVLPDYKRTGKYGFRTHGVDNPSWDRDIVDEGQVVGKLVFHNFYVGVILTYVQERIWVLVLIILLVYILSFLLRQYSKLTKQEKELEAKRKGKT